MNSFAQRTRARFVLGCALALLPLALIGQTREIHLRNEIISTPPRAAGVAPRIAAQSPATTNAGLFLVQFETPLDAAGRAEMRLKGVDLLKYVPDGAFIARLNRVSPQTVAQMSNVRWVGQYRPDHKIHPRLTAAIQNNSAASVAVTVLLSPRVSPADLARVRALLVSVQHVSRLRQGVFVRADLPTANLAALAQSAAVLWIEPAPKHKLVDELASKIVGGDDGLTGTPTVTQQLGFAGNGIIVCVADTGLSTGDTNTMHPDLFGRVTGFQYYGSLTDGSDGYGHGTHCAGILAGNAATGETDPATGAFYGLGVASSASLFIERIFDADANEVSPFPSDAKLTQDAVRHGARIGSNSWGNDVQGEYDTDASQFDELVRDADPSTPGDQPYILEFSAGNAGSGAQTMDSPASGKNVIATGASENITGTLAGTYGLYADGPDTMADFSSRGPCEDGRIKPDFVAPGTWIASAASAAAPNEAAIAWSTIDANYVYMGGTSMSGPHAAGAAAIFVQYYQSTHTNAMPSPALVKAALINSSDPLDVSNGGPGPVPNFDEGWGRLNLTNLVVPNTATAPRFYQYVDQTALLTNGQVFVQHAFVEGSGQPLKITLTYTDVPGFAGAIPALVNDLDLEVVGPDGTLYRGNQFSGGESVPNAPSPDNLNNVEGVLLAQPLPGDYQVRVRARSVVEDARLDTSAIDQDFALVISGDLSRQGVGVVLLDRTNYTAPGTIQIEVLDPARAGSNTVNVTVSSTTETPGEIYALHASGSYGAFTGAVATVVGFAAPDGRLQIHNGDVIEADYTDSTGTKRSALATAQLNPPSLTGVVATNDLGIITIGWDSSEPASSIVYYGTNNSFNQSASNSALTTSHVLKLNHLVTGRTYSFYVSSTDAAGNTASNNNAGANYSFVAVTAPTVLLVDDYDSVGEDADGSYVIPDSVYTNALAATGFSFSFWKVNDRGYPQLSDLQGFQVVMWRTTDDIVNYTGTNDTLTAGQETMIEAYLNGGGSFFMASMGILSQLGDDAFRANVLQVAGFAQNPDPPSPCDCDEYFSVPAIVAAPANPITGGMSMTLDYDNYPSFDLGFGTVYGPDFGDTFTPATNANTLFLESVSGKPCGMCFPAFGQNSPGRVVFLSFPLDAMPATGTAPDTEVVFLRNALNFLAPGANGKGVIFLDSTAHTVPDQVVVQVGDSDLAGMGHAQVTFSANSATNQTTITLFETTHPGLFQGAIALVASNAAPGQLAAKNGDTITAAYFDASNNTNVTATATIDTTAPVITQVAATTQYGTAVVTWTTSKPGDSLVQYGESLLPDRTVYSGVLTTNHSVAIGGLSANRVYYYEVSSRDAAGNTTVNDNNDAFFTFQTLRAPSPPWFDDLESGAANWSVIPDATDGTDENWELGTPNNGLATSAYSGANCWGSNLNGDSFNNLGYASSFLYSPVIDLTGMSSATLTFWDNFDFSSAFEDGQLGISTNSSTPPASVPTVVDYQGLVTGGWEQETVDLTPWVGQNIQVVWYYFGFQFGAPCNGWLVDDVSITGVAGGGTIVVNKNLAQGSFTLSGPINSGGTYTTTTISNIPPGPYTVQFSDVAFYQTPVTQTNTLTNGTTLTFTGTYSFIDANHNGISDAWEQYYFGNVSTNRTAATDSDHDGMTDYAEFIAGTDPTNPESNLRFLTSSRTNGHFEFQWSAIPGRIYQVETSTNLHNWQALTGWMQSTASPMTYKSTNAPVHAQFYRVQVMP